MNGKYEKIALVFAFVAVVLSSCTMALYYQNHPQSSTIKVENPTSVSADSSSIDLVSPLEK